MSYELPQALIVGGVEYKIRSDYRVMIDICAALNDAELDDNSRGYAVLYIFYPGFDDMPSEHYPEAIRQCFWFLRGGKEEDNKISPKLLDWEQDFDLIVAPINRVMGKEVRALEYMHWWTWLAAYREIGECLFSQVVGIRSKKAKGKKLDKSEQEFYRNNQDIIILKTNYTQAEDSLLNHWGVK